MDQYTKDNIKARLYRQVAREWGIRNYDNLDPTVKLLLEAMSSEIFTLSTEVVSVGERLLDRLSAIMLPHNSISPQPSHAVLSVQPYQDSATMLLSDVIFYKNSKLSQAHSIKQLEFSPIEEVTVLNLQLKYIVRADEISGILPSLGTYSFSPSKGAAPLLNNKILLGVKGDINLLSQQNLRLYIDVPFANEKSRLLHSLRHTKCRISGEEVSLTHSLNTFDSGADISSHYNTINQIRAHIANKYSDHFVVLNTKGRSFSKGYAASEYLSNYDLDPSQPIDNDIIWIELEFPVLFAKSYIAQMEVYVNSVIIANLRLAKTNAVIDNISSVVALPQSLNEHFVAVDKVIDNNGAELERSEIKTDEKSGTYSVRRGGVEKFNSQDAKSFLDRLISILYDEGVSLASIDNELMDASIKKLQEYIDSLRRASISFSADSESTSYVILDNINAESTSVGVEYFLTNGMLSNGISLTDTCDDCSNIDIDSEQLIFVSSTRGGAAAPSVDRKRDLYRYTLLSKERIFTKEDIYNFCSAYYGESILSVDITLGYTIGDNPNAGFERCLNVDVTTNALDENEKCVLKTDLYNDLKCLSPETFVYNVTLK